ncbi:MAG: PfkB family carbohydrate kinase [Pseudomonadota bacterium]
MTLLVVGSVAFDTIETPEDRRERILGGAANYFSVAAAHLAPVRLVAVVGEDFPQQHLDELARRGIDTNRIERVPGGKTFHWAGRYGENCNERETLATELNVFAEFKPTLDETYRDTRHVFLANIHPELQLSVLDQVKTPDFVAADTMNLWIDTTLPALRKVLARVHALFINEGEALQLSGESNLIRAGQAVARLGPKIVVLKLGAYGAIVFKDGELLFVPALPLDRVVDPTGAGDSFAGGFMGYLSRQGRIDRATLHRAAAVGAVMGAFACQGFGLECLLTVTPEQIEASLAQLHRYIDFGSSAVFT